MTEVDRLRVVYELMDGQFRAGMERMRRLSDRTSRDILNSAGKAERSFQGMALKATAAAASIAALGASLAKLNKYTDSYRTIENRLRSIGEASDEAAEKLLAVAIRSRSPIEELSTSVARMQKATGDGFEITLRRAETLNKLLAVGGATAREVSSVMTQLSQALTSGTLQGDELRSLREAAPVEVLDAIAQAAGVTRGELKKMGEDGALTTEIITKALDNLAETADRKFGQTAQTAGQALTNISSAMTVFVGRLDEGLGASDRLIVSLNDLSAWLTENIAEAEQFGQSVSAAIETASQYADELRGYLEQIGVLTEAAFNPDAAVSFGEEIRSIIEFIAEMNGVIEGAAAVAREAFFSIADSIAEGMSDAINTVISAVESMINGVLSGVKAVAGAIDKITGAAASLNSKLPAGVVERLGLRTEGTDLAGSVGSVDFGRVELGPRLSSGESFGEIYQGVKEAGRNGILDGIDEAVSGYGGNLARRQIASQTPLSLDPEGLFPESPATATSGGGGGGSSGGGSKGRKGRKGSSGKTESPFFEDVQRDILALERQIELVGKSNEEIATAKARWELLDEAKKRGLTVNDELNAKIEQQASEVGRLTGELERAEIAQEQFDQAVDGIADAMAGALVAGEDLREGLANVFKGIASDLIRSGIQKLLLNLIPGLAGGGGGGIKLPSFEGGGFTGYGSRSGGIDGRGGMPAILHPNETVVDHTKGQGTSGPVNININVSGARGNAEIQDMVARGVQQGLGSYDKALPGRVQQINAHPRKR